MLELIMIILAAVVMLSLAVAMSLVLGWANKAFAVEVDPRVEQINAVLPAANCGACGYVGCNDYAEAIARGDETDVSKCAPGGESCAKAIAQIMGLDVSQKLPYKAVVHCAAKREQRLKRNPYEGEMTCQAANMVAGVQGCTFGCLGIGDCMNACPFDAIEVINGLATINYDKCVGCGVCAKVCPRNIITIVPFKSARILVVACSNKEFGAGVREVCEVGCIGCKVCTKFNELLEMDGNLPTINYDKYDPKADDFSQSVGKCPRETLVYIGQPTADDIEKTKDETLPEVVEADFKTTVDDAEWRG